VKGSDVLGELTKCEWLLRLSEEGQERLAHAASPLRASPGLLLQEGDACGAVTLLYTGRVQVTKRRASGRAITLYTVEPGQLCVLEVLAVLTRAPFRAEAAADAPVTGVAIPGDVFRALVDAEPRLRDAVFRMFEARLAAALEMIGDVALERLESRLAATLLRHAHGMPDVHVTHEQLAHELACAREAVSRILEHWERAGIVRLGRGHIHLGSPTRLGGLHGQNSEL